MQAAEEAPTTATTLRGMRGAVEEGPDALLTMRIGLPYAGDTAEAAGPATTPTPRGAAAAAAAPGPEKAAEGGAYQAIAAMAERLGLAPGVRDRAKDVFRRMEELRGKTHYYTKGRGGDTLYAACIYVACRSEGTPRTFKELAAATRDGAAARKDIGKLITLIRRRLGDEAGGRAMDIGVVRAGDYVERFGRLVGMGEQEVGAVREAARRLEERLDVRRNPDSTAAAIIYMAVERRPGAGRTLRDVSAATGVAENTIKQAYREICPHAELLFG
ncbi:hypothetical protein ACP4OV_021582 [Aristida adscensionis]